MKTLPVFLASAAVVLASCTTSDKRGQSVIAAGHGAPAAASQSFEKGSPKAELVSVMGRPDSVSSRAAEVEVYYYRFSTVRLVNGRVAGWNNASGNLKSRGPGDAALAKDEPLSRSLDDGPIDRPSGAVVHGLPARGSSESFGATNPDIHYVDSHQRADGSQVGGYYRTRANSSTGDNFSSRGNRNAVTGKKGYR